MRNVIVAATLLAAACATTPQTTAMAPIEHRAEVHEIEAQNIKLRWLRTFEGIITCEVINLGAQPVLVDRDAIVLVTPTGERRARIPGGLQTTYLVPPSGSHVVNVRYDLAGILDDDVAQLDFARAILLNGQPVPIPPLAIAPKHETPLDR
jgi:hypothetical protein